MITWLYEALLSSATGRPARVLMCGIIGGIVGLVAGLAIDDPNARTQWHWFLGGGTGCGLLAGIVLTVYDLTRGKR